MTLLARLSGETVEPVTANPFPDVPADEYYAASVAWAVSAGIINGFDDGTFQPKTAITREQMAHIMTLYLKHKGMDVQTVDETSFHIPDLDKIQPYAKNDVLFCYANALLNGRGSDGFVPQGNATRAEACTILLRMHDYLHAHTAAEETPATVEAVFSEESRCLRKRKPDNPTINKRKRSAVSGGDSRSVLIGKEKTEYDQIEETQASSARAQKHAVNRSSSCCRMLSATGGVCRRRCCSFRSRRRSASPVFNTVKASDMAVPSVTVVGNPGFVQIDDTKNPAAPSTTYVAGAAASAPARGGAQAR